MVTIEQKLRMFENLIQHDISEKFQDESKKQEDYYKKLIMDNEVQENKISQEMISETKNKLQKLYTKLEAETKKNYREVVIEMKEELLSSFVSKLENSLTQFVKTKEYENYLSTNLKKVCRSLDCKGKLYLYMTKADVKQYSAFVKDELMKNIVQDKNKDAITSDIIILEGKEEMIGGIIIENEERDSRFDLSMKKSIEDYMPEILQGLNEIIEGEGKK